MTDSGTGSYNTNPAAFTLRVLPAPNIAPTVPVTGVSHGATYEIGAVPVAGCDVVDAEDGKAAGNVDFAAALSPVSGPLAAFGLGSQTASCAYSDGGGLSASAGATYSIVDSVAPSVQGGAADSNWHADNVAVACTASDGGSGLDSCVVTGYGVGLGTHTLTATATDNVAPELDLPANVVVEATGPDGAVATWAAPTAVDEIDGPVGITCTADSGVLLPLGATIVTCSASDVTGNTATGYFTVTVEDTTAPALSLPADITAEATSPQGAAVAFQVTANDIVDGAVDVTCSDVSGATFPLGTTIVTCASTDKAGNEATGSFLVTVQDTTAPVITVARPTGPSYLLNEAVNADFSCIDGVTGVASCVGTVANGAPIDSASVGSKTFTVTAVDHAGNTATQTVTYKVLFKTGAGCSQILQLVNTDGTSVFKQGSTVPFKLRVCDACGVSVSTPGTIVNCKLVKKVAGTTETVINEAPLSTTLDTAFRWDSTGQQWIFNLSTKNLTRGYTYVYQVMLSDGTSITIQFGLR